MSDTPSFRIKPLLPPEWGDDQYDALSAFPTARDFVLANWETDGARGTYGLGALLSHPPLAKSFLTFNNHISKASTLSARIRELVILRIGWLRRSEYEYLQHVVLGKRAGLTDEDIARIQEGPTAAGWNDEDRALLQATDDLYADACISDDTWAALTAHFEDRQIMDLVMTVGCYEVAAMVFRSFKLPLEPGVPPLSDDERERMYGQRRLEI